MTTVLVTGLAIAPGIGHAEPTRSPAEVEREVTALRFQAGVASERYNDVRLQLAAAQQRVSAAQARVEAQSGSVRAMQAVLGDYANLAYRNGSVDETLQLLVSDDPQAFLQQLGTLDRLSARQQTALRRMLATQTKLARDRAAAAREIGHLRGVQAELRRAKSDVESKLAQAQRLLDQLQARDRARLAAAQRASRDAGRRDRVAASAVGSHSESGGSSADAPAPSGSVAAVLAFARAQLGEPYQWGSAGPDSWDCSGLTMMAWRQAGVSLPHSSTAQYSAVRHIDRSQLRPGDLVFFYSPISHVGIYVGGNRVLAAPATGDVVKYQDMSTMDYAGAGRPG